MSNYQFGSSSQLLSTTLDKNEKASVANEDSEQIYSGLRAKLPSTGSPKSHISPPRSPPEPVYGYNRRGRNSVPASPKNHNGLRSMLSNPSGGLDSVDSPAGSPEPLYGFRGGLRAKLSSSSMKSTTASSPPSSRRSPDEEPLYGFQGIPKVKLLSASSSAGLSRSPEPIQASSYHDEENRPPSKIYGTLNNNQHPSHDAAISGRRSLLSRTSSVGKLVNNFESPVSAPPPPSSGGNSRNSNVKGFRGPTNVVSEKQVAASGPELLPPKPPPAFLKAKPTLRHTVRKETSYHSLGTT